MRTPPTNCPDCNSVQRFARRYRAVGGMIEVYIACSVCGWEQILETLTPEESRSQRRDILARNRAVRRRKVR